MMENIIYNTTKFLESRSQIFSGYVTLGYSTGRSKAPSFGRNKKIAFFVSLLSVMAVPSVAGNRSLVYAGGADCTFMARGFAIGRVPGCDYVSLEMPVSSLRRVDQPPGR